MPDLVTLDLPTLAGSPGPRVTVPLSNYPATLRQFIVTELGHDAPTVIITNDTDTSANSSSPATHAG